MRYNARFDVRACSAWDIKSPGQGQVYNWTGNVFADVNDDVAYVGGMVYWERNLLRFYRHLTPFTPFELQKAQEAMGPSFALPPQVAGLTDGAAAGIREALVGILESFRLLIPFKQDWLEDDVRRHFHDRLFTQLDRAMADNAIGNETWFLMFEYLCGQLIQLEHPLRVPETRLWWERAKQLVRTLMLLQLFGYCCYGTGL